MDCNENASEIYMIKKLTVLLQLITNEIYMTTKLTITSWK